MEGFVSETSSPMNSVKELPPPAPRILSQAKKDQLIAAREKAKDKKRKREEAIEILLAKEQKEPDDKEIEEPEEPQEKKPKKITVDQDEEEKSPWWQSIVRNTMLMSLAAGSFYFQNMYGKAALKKVEVPVVKIQGKKMENQSTSIPLASKPKLSESGFIY